MVLPLCHQIALALLFCFSMSVSVYTICYLIKNHARILTDLYPPSTLLALVLISKAYKVQAKEDADEAMIVRQKILSKLEAYEKTLNKEL